MLDIAPATLITTQAALNRVCTELRKHDRIALDMEADSLHHYFEKVCLLQLSLDGEHYILDPLAKLSLGEFMSELAQHPLILHGADYDLRMLRRDFGFHAKEVFDTMIAAQMLGYKQFGLAALVEKICDVKLIKRGQKADWSRRPLSPDLLKYAADDTRFLNILADTLQVDLERTGRLEWHREMCRHLLNAVSEDKPPPDPDRAWKIKGWHTLKSPRSKMILRCLWQWREDQARNADLPAFRIMSNEALVSLAAWGEEHDDLSGAPHLPRTCTGQRLRTLKKALVRGRTAALREPSGRENNMNQNSKPVNDRLLAALRKRRDEIAAGLELDPALVAPAAALTGIAKSGARTVEALQSAGDLYDWQTDLLGPGFTEVLNAFAPDDGRKRTAETARPTESPPAAAGGE